MLRVLVTAVGSELSFSILKALKIIKTPIQLFGCDIYSEVVGKYWVNKFYQVPRAAAEHLYITAIRDIVQTDKIDALIPTNDLEIIILSKYRDEFLNNYNCHILLNPTEEILRFNDKWFSYLWFHEKSIPCPETYLIKEIINAGFNNQVMNFPMILKPRIGGGSRSIFKINSLEELENYSRIFVDHILQEYLYPENEEFTAGVYRTYQNEVFVIILKRTLKFGMTNTAEIIINYDLEMFVKQCILKTNLKGSVNVQFRLTQQGPKVLEINPRFSGTTGIRANFGFNDVEMWLLESVQKKKVLKPKVKEGLVLRYFEEQYHF